MSSSTRGPRSCDRCHALKQRCQRVCHSVRCDQCQRLGLACRNDRPVKQPGRRPKPYTQTEEDAIRRLRTSLKDSSSDSEPLLRPHSGGLRVVTGPQASEEHSWMMAQILDSDEYLRHFVLGPSFCDGHRATIVTHFISTRSLMEDAYIACALLWSHHDAQPAAPQTAWLSSHVYSRAAAALNNLRSLKVKDENDMMTCLVLGGCILSMSSKLRGGKGMLWISSQILAMIKPVYDAKGPAPWMGAGFLTCVASFETFECLFRARIPTLSVQIPTDGEYIDRNLGVTASILPLLCELCTLSHRLLHSGRDIDAQCELDSFEDRVRGWQPIVPEGFAARYTAVEVSHMLCQAQATQSAALLILHRLRHPFGTSSETGFELASRILSLLDMNAIFTQQDARCTDIALMVTCVELPGEAERMTKKPPSTLSQELVDAVSTLALNPSRYESGLYWYDVARYLDACASDT